MKQTSSAPPSDTIRSRPVIFQESLAKVICIIEQKPVVPIGINPIDDNNINHDDDHSNESSAPNGTTYVGDMISDIFFELANSPQIGYRLSKHPHRSNNIHSFSSAGGKQEHEHILILQQDQSNDACGIHTGGIIWETSYLLLEYLLHVHINNNQQHDYQSHLSTNNLMRSTAMIGGGANSTSNRTSSATTTKNKKSRTTTKSEILATDNNKSFANIIQSLPTRRYNHQRVLEIGAGCGLLGQVLGTLVYETYSTVVLTEAGAVMNNLCRNVENNRSVIQSWFQEQQRQHGDGNDHDDDDDDIGSSHHGIHVCQLDWTCYEQDVKKAQPAGILTPHSFDVIVGTDVIYVPTLVEPLLQTIQYMSHEQTVIYLCLQIRCAASHSKLLQMSSQYNFQVEDITATLDTIPECSWGQHMECYLFKLTVSSVE